MTRVTHDVDARPEAEEVAASLAAPWLIGAYTWHMTVREEAHQLIDAVPDDRLADAVELLRRWAETVHGERRRRFRTTATFDGEPDLGARAKEIAREAWSQGRQPA
jgi:hypothetical protein